MRLRRAAAERRGRGGGTRPVVGPGAERVVGNAPRAPLASSHTHSAGLRFGAVPHGTWREETTRTLNHRIGGSLLGRTRPRMMDVTDPATGRVTLQVPTADVATVDAAVGAAAAAFPGWAATPPLVRAQVMFRFRVLVERHADELAGLITAERGKVPSHARGSVIPVPEAFHSFGGWKPSPFEDHDTHGPEGVRFNTRRKTVTSRRPGGIRQGASFVMPTMS